MESLDDALRQLKAEYLREAGPRLVEIGHLLDVLDRNPGDRSALADLLRRFHAFAGSGTTYGLPGVTATALEAERACGDILSKGASPAASDLRALRERCALLHTEFQQQGVAAPTVRAETAPEAAHSTCEVLVVDDDPGIRELLTRLLEREGMSVRTAASRAGAIAALEARLPDGLVADVMLPDGSGYEIVKHVRSLPLGDATAALVISKRTGFLDKVEALQCGADGYFEKPVDWDALLWRLQHLVRRNRVEPARILYVEDDPHQAAYTRAILQSAGYEVRVCADPDRFEADISAFQPDLVLMDIVLPGISGYDLVRFVRQDERYATLPLIFLTTESQTEARIHALKAGGDELLIKPVAPILLLSAVAARVERARFLKSLLDRDGLTRLLTHSALLERARVAIGQSNRAPERPAAWVMMDLDRFKSVNDLYGHPVGDRVLSSLSALLRRRLRQADAVGRYGGEEFAVLLEGLDEAQTVRLVTRLLEEFKVMEHRAPDGSPFHVTFSAGVAMLTPGMDLDAWRRAADEALYAAKRQGRSRIVAASAMRPEVP